ncbi:MAG: Fe-S cluster assembly protein SufD [Fluviicola sp.]
MQNKLNFIKGLTPTNLSVNTAAQKNASNVLDTTDLPTTRTEAWKYTRVAKIGKIDFTNEASTVSSIENKKVLDTPYTLVFVNGRFSKELSTDSFPNGVTVQPLSVLDGIETQEEFEGDIFGALNLAYLNDGLHIKVAKQAVIDEPIQVLHILKGDAQLSNFKVQIDAEDFSKATVVQGFFSEDSSNSFVNYTSDIKVGVNTHFTMEKIQDEEPGNFHIGTDSVVQEKDSTFTINTITLNGTLVRNNLNIEVNGENCTTNLNGGYLLKEKQHVDNHTVVDHKVPNCNSNELYKGVMDENSTAVFNGKVFVRQDAQKINAFQSNRNVLLSDSATVNSKPELEIYADDVKCSHGSTTGQLDDEAIYYLRARGLSKKAATQLLVSAFIAEVISEVGNENVKAYIYKRLNERFGWDINPEDFG